MRFGVDISPAGPWGDPRTLAELARLAEDAGWDGVFVEDYVVYRDGHETYDPWIALAAVALATERVRIGPMVTPLPRRRPALVAAQAMTLDHLSGGRVVLGVGSGDPSSVDFTRLGEEPDARARGDSLDEALAVIDGLWAGRPLAHRGERFRVDDVALRPQPVQRPRIPIWVGGRLTARRPRERALRWDGACLYRAEPPDWDDLTPDDVAALRAEVARARGTAEGYDIAVGGRQPEADRAAEARYVTALAAAGATWWHEFLAPETPLERVRAHIAAGPLAVGGGAR
jgi:alkanesulfonate monooxygenase SsuD/methylene tetrahydromethanopterin reductase-like flavin-dependent oxidoreductase (luciferase family)